MNAWRGELQGNLAGREACIAVAMDDKRTGKMAARQMASGKHKVPANGLFGLKCYMY